MEAGGFVLAGGSSTRMGRDKALLPFRGITLLQHVAAAVEQAAGKAVVIGDPERYGKLGYPVWADRVPQCGPMGGVYTALNVTASDWNLVVACDMPMLNAPALRYLIDHALRSSRMCIAAAERQGELQPLCAVYHRRCLPILERAIRERRFAMKSLLSELDTEQVPLERSILANANTPDDWTQFERCPE